MRCIGPTCQSKVIDLWIIAGLITEKCARVLSRNLIPTVFLLIIALGVYLIHHLSEWAIIRGWATIRGWAIIIRHLCVRERNLSISFYMYATAHFTAY